LYPSKTVMTPVPWVQSQPSQNGKNELTHPNEGGDTTQQLETTQPPENTSVVIYRPHAGHAQNEGSEEQGVRNKRNDIPERESSPPGDESQEFEELLSI
jgi:hypothetical protein